MLSKHPAQKFDQGRPSDSGSASGVCRGLPEQAAAYRCARSQRDAQSTKQLGRGAQRQEAWIRWGARKQAHHHGLLCQGGVSRCCGVQQLDLAREQQRSHGGRNRQDGTCHRHFLGLPLKAAGGRESEGAVAAREGPQAGGQAQLHRQEADRLPALDCVWWPRPVPRGAARIRDYYISYAMKYRFKKTYADVLFYHFCVGCCGCSALALSGPRLVLLRVRPALPDETSMASAYCTGARSPHAEARDVRSQTDGGWHFENF